MLMLGMAILILHSRHHESASLLPLLLLLFDSPVPHSVFVGQLILTGVAWGGTTSVLTR